MLRLLKHNAEANHSRQKGQWFIISAIIASVALLALSFIFRGYFVADTAMVQMNDESYYLHGVKESIADIEANSDCTTLQKSMEELDYFATKEFSSKGILFRLIYDTNCPLSSTINTKLLLLQSANMETWEGQRPVIAGVVSSGGTGSVVLDVPLDYDFRGEAEIYQSPGSGLLATSEFLIPAGNLEAGIGPVSVGNYVIVRNFTVLGKNSFVVTVP